MTDGQLDAAIFDGEAARALLSNEVLMKALAECERTATEKMITALDVAVREENWYLTRAVRELKAQLLKFANSGTAAKETKTKRARSGQK